MKSKDFEHYQYGFLGTKFLMKHWLWFTEPFEVVGSAMSNFFSYNKLSLANWQRRDGLTSILDLSQDLDQIWSSFRPNFIAKQIKKAEKNGIKIKISDDYNGFYKIYKNFRRLNNLSKDRLGVLKGHSVLLVAYYQDEMIAGGIFITNSQYWRAYVLASWRRDFSGKNRELLGQANRLLIWEAIKIAKSTGHKFLDLGGISPASNNLKLRSLAEFKEAFGGTRKACYYYFKVYSPIIKYWLRLKGFKNI